METRRERPGDIDILSGATSWSRHWSHLRCLDSARIELAVGGECFDTRPCLSNVADCHAKFWSTSIVCVVVQVIGFIYLRESTSVSFPLGSCVHV